MHAHTHTHTQFPEELVTYGGNGQVLSNWAQFWLLMYYLSIMDEDQTLVLYSGHPMGLFPSHSNAPRCVISNGMVSKLSQYINMHILSNLVYLYQCVLCCGLGTCTIYVCGHM